jgi:heat-inducible transcriptional repressor
MMASMVERERSELGERKSAVLHAVVDQYVRTGEPVSSESIVEHAGLGVSSATIRNEMAALEELGYLTHPHTSAGRIPTDLGYRHFVDSLPAGGRLREAQRRLIASYFAEAIVDLEEVLKGSVQLLSRLTQYAGLAVPPSAVEEPIVRIELVDMGPTLMILAIGQHGRVDKQVIDRPDRVDSETMRTVDGRLQGLRGLTYPEAQARVLQLAAEGPETERDLLLHVAETLRIATQGEGSAHMVIGGVSNLADEAQAMRRETLRRLFETLEREQEVLGVLADIRSSAGELNVTIGAEHPTTGEWEASLITAPFKTGETALGTIGVVGPTRMDYLSAMASVRAVAKRLSELATELDH